MTSHTSSGPGGQGDQDPWLAFGYLVAGVGFYGFIGWGVGRWLHASFLTPVGLLVGLSFGLYLVFTRYRFRDPDSAASLTSTPIDTDRLPHPQPDRDDRGETP